MKKCEERSINKELQSIKRGCSIVRRLSPRMIELNLLRAFLRAIIPYISIYMMALILDELASGRNVNTLILYTIITVTGTLVISVISEYISKKIDIKERMFEPTFQKLLNDTKMSMSYMYLEDNKTNELREKILGNMFAAGGGINSIIKNITAIFENVISLIIAIIMSYEAIIATSAGIGKTIGIANSSWFSAFIILILILCIVMIIRNSKIVNKKVFELYKDGADTNALSGYYNDVYLDDDQAGKDVRIFDQRQFIVDELVNKCRMPWLRIVNGTYRLNQRYLSINLVISTIIGGIIYVFIGVKALAGIISIGSVTKTYASISRIISAVEVLSVSITEIISNNNYLDLLYEYIDLPKEANEGTKVPEISNKKWEIEFHDVSFCYPSQKKYALKNLSFKINTNSRIAIVGMNGSGKTTMIKLLCRFYNPTSGYITLNGVDIKEYEYNSYIKLFSVIFQDFQILAFSVGQNVATSIAYDAERVWKALKMAGVADRVCTMPLQLEHPIYKNYDENGIDVSGGEAQKIAIARAIYKNAPIFILDEPTSALDPTAEAEIYNKFNEIIHNKTALYISHRLSSCKFCDEIVVFHKGVMIQKGKHSELILDEKGKYYELWNAQAQYYVKLDNESENAASKETEI